MLWPTEHVVDRPELRYSHFHPCFLRRRPQLLLKELVDCFLRLPHIDDSPTTLYRTCYVKDSPLSCLAAESLDDLIILLLSRAR